MQEKDKNIIEELKEHGRASIRDIAKKTGLRPSTVHVRIQKLTEEKVIEKFTVQVNNEAAEENFIVFILIKTSGEIPNAVFKEKAIKEVFGVTGEFDMLLKCKFKDINAFNDFLLKFRKNQAVASTLTLVSTVVVKEEL